MHYLLLFLVFVTTLSAIEEPILFLTWKKDPEHTICAVWLTEDPSCQGLIQWRKSKEDNYKQKAANKSLFQFNQRNLYVLEADLSFLKPNETYEFKIRGMPNSPSF